jgi:uncharacterized protein (DUF1697 family)
MLSRPIEPRENDGMRYVALLRGINVGGNNPVSMAKLKVCLETAGFEEVTTYIQSGNVIFTAASSPRDELTRRIEVLLTKAFRFPSSVVLRTRKQMQDVVARAPRGFGGNPAKHRYDVIFLKEPLTASTAIESMVAKEGVDAVHPGAGVLYFSRLIAKASQSRLSRIVSMPIYQSLTIRNWNTTTKLLQMM